MGAVLFGVGFVLFVGLVCRLGRGKTHDRSSTHGDGGTGAWIGGGPGLLEVGRGSGGRPTGDGSTS